MNTKELQTIALLFNWLIQFHSSNERLLQFVKGLGFLSLYLVNRCTNSILSILSNEYICAFRLVRTNTTVEFDFFGLCVIKSSTSFRIHSKPTVEFLSLEFVNVIFDRVNKSKFNKSKAMSSFWCRISVWYDLAYLSWISIKYLVGCHSQINFFSSDTVCSVCCYTRKTTHFFLSPKLVYYSIRKIYRFSFLLLCQTPIEPKNMKEKL